MKNGIIYAISISPERRQLKKEVSEALILINHGIKNDGHGSDWSCQITCLNWASVLKSNKENNMEMGPGDFSENILIAGLNFSNLLVGSQFRLGESVVLEVAQIGEKDHPSVVTQTFGVNLLPSEGLFCKVIKSGTIKKGDLVEMIYTLHNKL